MHAAKIVRYKATVRPRDIDGFISNVLETTENDLAFVLPASSQVIA